MFEQESNTLHIPHVEVTHGDRRTRRRVGRAFFRAVRADPEALASLRGARARGIQHIELDLGVCRGSAIIGVPIGRPGTLYSLVEPDHIDEAIEWLTFQANTRAFIRAANAQDGPWLDAA